MIAEQLKRSILQAAIQGKLAEQLESDGDAHHLLREAQKEKASLIKEGKIRKEKPLPEITEYEIPFDIPKNWVWCYLQDVGLLQRGKSKHRPRNDPFLFVNGAYPFVQTGDISKAKYQGGLITSYSSKYNEEGLKQSKIWAKGTLCITIAANIAETGFLNFNACFPDSAVGFTPLVDETIAQYAKLFIDFTKADIEEFAPATAQKNINLEILNRLIIPLPPIREQKRIIEHAENIFRETIRLKDDELKLDVLQRAFPKKMKDSVLQYAVEGKLTEQLKSDGDAHDLVKEIQKEKARLVKEGKIKKEKPLPEITEDEIPFDIPENWCWVRISDLIDIINGLAFKPSDWSNKGLPIIRIQNLNNPDAPFNYCNFKVKDKFIVQNNDLLIGWSGTPGTSFGAFIWRGGKAVLNQHIFKAVFFGDFISPDYMRLLINSRLIEMISESHGGVGLKHITKEKFENMLLPLPPFKEQARILEKYNQLLNLCQELKNDIYEKINMD